MKFSLQINVDLALMMSAPAGFARLLPAIGLFSPNEKDPDPDFFSLPSSRSTCGSGRALLVEVWK
jgi:hypothetical protein